MTCPFTTHRTVAELDATKAGKSETSRRADVFAASTFEAWHVLEFGGEVQPLSCYTARTLNDARDNVATQCSHKQNFIIRETDAMDGRAMLHVYTIKRKSTGKWTGERMAHDHYAAHLFSIAVAAFTPVEPWRWSPGCDVVNGDRMPVIEGDKA